MRNEIKWLEAIAPDMVDVFLKRFSVLRSVALMAPIGRRALAAHLNMSERVLRTHTDMLRKLGMIQSSPAGMMLTSEGQAALTGLSAMVDSMLGLQQSERELAQILNIDRCFIVSGDSDRQDRVLDGMGTILNDTLAKLLPEGNNVIVVMGGNTMAQVAKEFSPELSNKRQLTFVPGRGGMGQSLAMQANTVCSIMAERTHGESQSMYVPEKLSQKSYQPLLEEPSVQLVLGLIKQSNVVIHGIGCADEMAERREVDPKILHLLKDKNAVGEAFGCFYNQQGEIVYRVPRIGLQFERINSIDHVFAVAGGHTKAQAIRSYMNLAPQQTYLVTDEGAANLILKK
ncbi:SorC family transcriptional regulator [Pediococcus damnosus LMG 28219]|uniref:sugar-binding transcriptional regulator n=1 Tax=Pediococcus damnosus TaxID=51663 RepID=UPI00061F849E|nr:sugar-binding domain-containing protein [Pediococcus damnosus]KJU74262.1 SorC family transcriptional regulator [Pediococcus damnosus LMG 28219]